MSKLNLLLLRGLAREQRHWGSFGERLEATFESQYKKPLKVHYLDLAGAGTEIGRESPRSMSGIYKDLRTRFLKMRSQYQVDESFYCVALSLAGMALMEWCSREGEDLKAAVVINTSVAGLCPPWWRMRPSALLALLGALKLEALEREHRVLKATTRRLSEEDISSYAQKWAAFAPPAEKVRETALKQMQAAAFFGCPKKIKVPLLAIASKKDALIDSRCTLRIAQKLDLPLEVHPFAGHDLALDDPEWLAAKITNFLGSQQGA